MIDVVPDSSFLRVARYRVYSEHPGGLGRYPKLLAQPTDHKRKKCVRMPPGTSTNMSKYTMTPTINNFSLGYA
jgi:hypothetical protein